MHQPMAEMSLTESGRFVVGANYWASHAGTRMWADWRPDVVETDFRRLREAGLQVLRVFPLWPDFQPLTLLRTAGGRPVEFRHGEDPLPDDDCRQAGLSAQAVGRLGELMDLAAKHELKLIVGLVTGWMSGRLHVPPAFDNTNVLTDPAAIQWEVRMVRHLVRQFRDHPAVLGWDLGNECNCMGAATREEAWVWTAAIANAIRVEDPSRPVVSGMHSLTPTGEWRMQDQGELTDLLTTHPYPVFTPHCDQDPINTMRSSLHSAAESRFYADIGGRPCLCQEIGTLGPMLASEKVAADFARTALFSLWANDIRGFMWWCAHDQTELEHAPYDWCAVERELGLLRVDGSAKPVLDEIGRFRQFLESLPFDALPPRRREAVCILTDAQDHWGVAFSAFLLAKQAGFDLEFQHETQPLKEADLYLLPCLTGHRMISRRRLMALLDRVRSGATLYLSLDDGMPSEFEALTGLVPQWRQRRAAGGTVHLEGLEGTPTIPAAGRFGLTLEATRAIVLGAEPDGNPGFSVVEYGRGQVYFLNTPLEMTMARTPGAFHSDEAPQGWAVYRHVAGRALAGRAVTKRHPTTAATEHPLDANRRLIVVINHRPAEAEEQLSLGSGWRTAEVYRGEIEAGRQGAVACTIGANDALVFSIERD
jgi:hypothetical protein